MGALRLLHSKSKVSIVNKSIVIATMHEKDRVIRPAFEHLPVKWLTAPGLNTDQFGTFTGEIKRNRTAFKTAVAKAKEAIKLSGAEIAIASEGSFGPHPSLPWLPSDSELLIWYDAQTDTVIREHIISMETNYAQKVIKTKEELFDFAKKAKFPSHGIDLKPFEKQENAAFTRQLNSKYHPIYKGITEYDELELCFDLCCDRSNLGEVWVETDMRAHMNPTRMKLIAELAQKLANRIATACPKCDSPGFGLIRTEVGLPCSNCEMPTELILNEVWGCVYCNHTEKRGRKDGLKQAAPANCPFCNP